MSLRLYSIKKNKYPWMVALVDFIGKQFCGGTLVASKYVISAAHCVSIRKFKVREKEIMKRLQPLVKIDQTRRA